MPPRKQGNPDEVALDFSQVKPFEALSEKPVYLATVTKLDIGPAKSNPKRQVSNLELTIDGPEEVQGVEAVIDDDGNAQPGDLMEDSAGDPIMVKAKGRKLFRTYTLEPQALPFLYEFLKGVDPEVELGEDFIYNPKEYMGLQCGVKIQNEGYLEQVRARVKRILPASAAKS